MTEQQESSNVVEEHTGNIDGAPNFVSDIDAESPIVTLSTPFPQSAMRTHAATLRKLQEVEKEVKAQQR